MNILNSVVRSSGSSSRGVAQVAVSRGRGMFVNRTSANANARQILQTRRGRGQGGRPTRRQLRNALRQAGV